MQNFLRRSCWVLYPRALLQSLGTSSCVKRGVALMSRVTSAAAAAAVAGGAGCAFALSVGRA